MTVITHVRTNHDGRLLVRGTTADDGEVRRVRVNGTESHKRPQIFSSGKLSWIVLVRIRRK